MSECYEAALEVNAALHTCEQSIDAATDALRQIRNVALAYLIMSVGEEAARDAMEKAVILHHRMMKAAETRLEGGVV